MKKQNYFKTIFLLLLFSINITAQVPAYVPTNGLVGWWPFTGNANDLSGNNNNGTVNGAILTTDRIANSNCAYSFNGSSSTINHNTQLIPSNSSFAISFWVKPILNNALQEFMSQNTALNAFYVGVNGNNMRCGDNWQTTGVIVVNNLWAHYVIVRDFGVNVKIYRNAILVATSPSDITLGGNLTDPLVIGKQYNNAEYYAGVFDDFGIWNRALSSCEINQLYTASPATISIVASNSLICAGQNVTLNVGGANTYTWSNSSNLTSVVVSPSVTMAYSVAGTNSAGCTSTSAINLTVNPNPIITVNNGAICAGQNFTINPNGANTYTIQGGNSVVSPSINSTYTVIGTNTLTGCVSQALSTSSLTVNPNPTITVNSGAICAGKNFIINPSGANTYTIQGGNAVVSPSINASYSVVGTSTAGCLSQAFATSNLTVNPNPTITVNSGTICVGQNFTINPTGANTYTIQGGNAVVSPTINTTLNFIIFYTVIGTNAAGCESEASATSTLTVNQCVGISSQNMVSGAVSIYPNPNNGEFTIELVSLNNTYITITNVLGQIIKTQKAELINQIDLNLFEKGIYLISVMDNNQSVYRGSMIKE